jgi:hypothetical protein
MQQGSLSPVIRWFRCKLRLGYKLQDIKIRLPKLGRRIWDAVTANRNNTNHDEEIRCLHIRLKSREIADE